MSKTRVTKAAAAAGAAAALSMAASAHACPPQHPADVAGAIQAMYSALAVKDTAAARAHLTPGFYIYDNGVRFDADGIVKLIQNAQATGASYRWAVTEPRVEFACDTAWITYVNRGGVTRDGKETPLSWLESGVLKHVGDRWLIEFMHSTRVPAK